MLFFFRSRLLASLFSVVAACGGNDDEHPPRNVVGGARSDARFSVLVEAINAADLATTLSSPGPCTVFVPTNDAFAELLTE